MADHAGAPTIPVSGKGSLAHAAATLEQLNEEAAAVRAQLATLRRDLAQVEQEFNAGPGAILRETNEQLVLAAMRAENIADAAIDRLGELARPGVGANLARLGNNVDQARVEYERGLQDLREANERLVIAALDSQQMETSALEAHRRQIAFLATVAHELRNPLMPLRLAAQMLDRARTDDVAHAKLQATIKGQVAQMTRLIGDLLDGSRISTGKFRLERTVVDLAEILQRAVETTRPGMDARGHRFTQETLAGKTPVLADTVRMVQVFGNLLENSSKYTREGGQISMRAVAGVRSVVVTIADNGIGITPAALPHVFDMFVRDAHATAVNEGLGIGLAIVRELVRAHEGTVVAKSRGKDLGSEFIVTLPLGAITMNAPAAALT
jgi:signal transduction histidine kinase